MKSKNKNNFFGKIIILIWLALLVLSACGLMVEASVTTHRDAKTNEYFELRAVRINNEEDEDGNKIGVNGKRQLIMELWGHNIDFEGFEVRFEYDDTKLQPSIISTTDPLLTNTTDTVNPILNIDKCFKFEDEFAGVVEFKNDVSEGNASNIIVAEMSLIQPYSDIPTSTHIIERTDPNEKEISKVIKTTVDGGVKLGEISFRMLTDEPFVLTTDPADTQGFYFGLVENFAQLSPPTGIKIQLNEEEFYHQYHLDEQSTFRFTDMTASTDADLSDLVVSSEENSDEATYKEYDLNPKFQEDKEAGTYTLTLMEYIDTIYIKATQSDENATMKIEVAKLDSDGNLVYEGDGTTITKGVPFGVTLNKLGEPDTEVTITVTAEDEVTTKTYKIVIERPYGIIKGTIRTPETTSTGIYKSDIRLYKSADVANIIDWQHIEQGKMDDIHDKLLTLKSQDYVTNDDGTYEIYVIPGTYDLLVDKTGYLDHVYASKTVTEGVTVDLGSKDIIAGDLNKDGVVNVVDLSLLMDVYGSQDTDQTYSIKYDFDEDGKINVVDLSILMTDYSEIREIE